MKQEELCPHCAEEYGESGDWGQDGEHYCIDCWPGYNLCKSCGDYRCEHLVPMPEDLKDPEYFSCYCGNEDCKYGFIEGSDRRIVNRKEWKEILQSWGMER